VSAAAVIDLRRNRRSRLAANLRCEDGIGLVELLIALLVLNVGIFATLGAFTSAATTIRRASHTSTAAAIADQQIETLRDESYANILLANNTNTNTTGADGRTYNVKIAVSTGRQTSGNQGSTSVAVATVTIRDGGPTGTVLVTSTSTYSRCTQSGVQGDTGQTPCQS
jgi:Tfp pilus assembly protein PilV